MPFLRSNSDATLNNATISTNDLVMRNPFLIFRLVFLGLLTNLAFLTLLFASWNVNATTSAGLSASATSIFIILQSCLIFLCVALAVADFFRPKLGSSRTLLECGWAGLLSLFQMGTAISASINGFAVSCRSTFDWNVCASTSLLMPLTWLSAFLTLAYLLTLFVTTLAHRTMYSDIWRRAVYDVEWFGQPLQVPSKEKVVQQFLEKNVDNNDDPYADYYEGIEATAARKRNYTRDSIEVPTPWVANPVRRGVDPPFAKKPGHLTQSSSSDRWTPAFSTPPLSLPGRSATVTTTKSGSRFIEKFRESTILARPESPSQFVLHSYGHSREDSFPRSVADVDQPIPLPRLSEWVKADSLDLRDFKA